MLNSRTLLPSTFYRVTSRALIFDNQAQLVVVQDKAGGWQLPGGGLEHDETFDECLAREVMEELGVAVTNISNILFSYTALSRRGHVILRLAAKVAVDSYSFKPADDMVAWKAVTKEELQAMDFIPEEGNIKDFADAIWSLTIEVD